LIGAWYSWGASIARHIEPGGTVQDFRHLKVWQAGHSLALDLYKVTQSFPKSELYGLTSQIRRAIVSVAANIVEGSARRTDRATGHYLEIALGSASEVECLILLARDLGLLSAHKQAELEGRISTIRRMLNAFIRRLRSTANGQRPRANG
jgi:four helix bundle protein